MFVLSFFYVQGPYTRKILEGAISDGKYSCTNGDPKEDFGGPGSKRTRSDWGKRSDWEYEAAYLKLPLQSRVSSMSGLKFAIIGTSGANCSHGTRDHRLCCRVLIAES